MCMGNNRLIRPLCVLICLFLAMTLLPAVGAAEADSAASISLNQTAVTLTVGTTTFLEATVVPEDADVSWSSDTPSVAAVDDSGTVTAVSVGTANIIAASDGAAAICTVSIVDSDSSDSDSDSDDSGSDDSSDSGSKIVAVTGVELVTPSGTSVSGGFQLSATVMPSDAADSSVVWTSSDEAVATVSETGYVTFESAGTVTITVETNDGGFTDSLSFTIKSSSVSVTGIDLNRSLLQLTEGSTAFIVVTVAPSDATNQAVTWESSDEAVATVSDTGAVTAVSPGKAVITATTEDGGFTASCAVIVLPENGDVAVTDITLNFSELELTEGSTAFLIAYIQPANASVPTVYWASSDPAVVSVDDDGVVTANASGSSTIYAFAAGGLKAECQISVPETAALTGSSEQDDGQEDSSADDDGVFSTDAAEYTGFTDVDESLWYGTEQQGVVKTAVELGIMNGYIDGTFAPDSNIKLSEAVKMAAIVHSIYAGDDYVFNQSEVVWYDTYVNYAIDEGIIQEDDFSDYAQYATRAEMAYIFCNAVPESYLEEINPDFTISDVVLIGSETQVKTEYAFQIYYLYQAGVLTGDDAETRAFRPDDNISRAEAAAIISRLCLPDTRVSFASID